MRFLLCGINAKYIHSNLAIFSLKAYADRKKIPGAEIILKEYTINNYVEDILQDLYEVKADVVIFSCYIWNISYVRNLIREVHNVDGIERIRLGSLEPRIVTDGFAAALAGLPKICPHFHLSLQSGCDATLQRMNRRYDTREYEEGCQILRKYFDHPAITTDVIVGFPGETEEEFAVTKEYLKRIHFYEMHIFQYSKREGTKAAVMEHQVPEPVKKERSNILLALEKKMSEEFRNYYVGKEKTALLEEELVVDGKTYFTGYTKEYVKVAFETEENMTNQFVTGKIKGKLKDDIYLLVEF